MLLVQASFCTETYWGRMETWRSLFSVGVSDRNWRRTDLGLVSSTEERPRRVQQFLAAFVRTRKEPTYSKEKRLCPSLCWFPSVLFLTRTTALFLLTRSSTRGHVPRRGHAAHKHSMHISRNIGITLGKWKWLSITTKKPAGVFRSNSPAGSTKSRIIAAVFETLWEREYSLRLFPCDSRRALTSLPSSIKL